MRAQMGARCASGYFSNSDARLKKGITDLTHGLNDVLKLRPVTYKWDRKGSDHRVEVGFLAQDVQRLIPEVVMARGPEKMLSLNYDALLPVAIKAIQDQQKIIDEQATRIARLEQRRTSLHASVLSGIPGIIWGVLLTLGLIGAWAFGRRAVRA